MSNQTIAIDEEGYFKLADGSRVVDDKIGHQWLNNLQVDEYGVGFIEHNGKKVVVESFDKPYVAAQVCKNSDGRWQIILPYQTEKFFDASTFCLDSWDRFHGLSENGVPFVLTNKAQAELFRLADEFSDDSITLSGQVYPTKDYYLGDDSHSQESFWSDKYRELGLATMGSRRGPSGFCRYSAHN